MSSQSTCTENMQRPVRLPPLPKSHEQCMRIGLHVKLNFNICSAKIICSADDLTCIPGSIDQVPTNQLDLVGYVVTPWPIIFTIVQRHYPTRNPSGVHAAFDTLTNFETKLRAIKLALRLRSLRCPQGLCERRMR